MATVAVNVSVPDPLHYDVPIVDAAGRPTPQFIQQWLKLRNVSLSLDEISSVVSGGSVVLVDYYTKEASDARFDKAYRLPAADRSGAVESVGLKVFSAFYRDGTYTGIGLVGDDQNSLPAILRDGAYSDIEMAVP